MNIKRMRWPTLAAAVAISLGAVGLWRATAAPRDFPEARFAAPDDSLEAVRNLSDAYVRVADAVLPAVVKINVRQRTAAPERAIRNPQQEEEMREFLERFFGPGFGDRVFPSPGTPIPEEFERQGVGSGVVVDAENGYILTNNHVVQDAAEIAVQLTDLREFEAEIVGADPSTDVAVIKIDASELTAAPMGDSNDLKIGEIVLAIGSPFSLGGTVTQGIVSATGRTSGILGQGGFEDFIQTDAAVNVGNSGGPLVNLRGEIVGINSNIATSTGLFSGVSFAVPIDLARNVMEDFITEGRVIRGYLGVAIGPVSPAGAKYNNMDKPYGAEVSDVTADSPAAKAGIQHGDIILELDGERVPNPNWFVIQVSSKNPGDKVTLGVLRGGEQKSFSITLTERPADDVLFADARTGRPGARGAASEDTVANEALGLTVKDLTDEVAEELGIEKIQGVVITDVERFSIAGRNGLQPGMVIVEVDGAPIRTVREFRRTANAGVEERGIVKLRVMTAQGLRPVYLEPPKTQE